MRAEAVHSPRPGRLARARPHAGFLGLVALTLAILVFEAPGGFEEADVLSVRPHADGLPPAGPESAASTARVDPAGKGLSQRPTIRT